MGAVHKVAWPAWMSGARALRLGVLVVLLLVTWWCQVPLLRSVGDHLVRQDPPAKAGAIYVLGGAALERSIAAARARNEGWSDRLVFTGSVRPDALRLFGLQRTEGEMGQRAALLAGVPEASTELLELGTSTMEEAYAVRAHATLRGYDTIMVITTEFHTRRVGNVFREAFRGSPVHIVVRAAPSARYNPARWWESEDGLLMVNNEYMKLLYYAWKY